MPGYQTEQESFWAGGFGNEYTERNTGEEWVASNRALFSKVLARAANVRSVLELGANLGLNLLAIRDLLPDAQFDAVEINSKAVIELKKIGGINVHHASILEFQPGEQFDFVFTKGVLIHLDPDMLPQAYDLIHAASNRYLCVAEYYNPKPVEVPYRGHNHRLFKRDFAGELLERHDDLRLLDYGFVYHRDPDFPQDDITWFLLEKNRK